MMNIKHSVSPVVIFVHLVGWRIGKGQGLSDVEYAMMMSVGSVSDSAVVMTLVHDCQVLDLRDDLFAPHDVPVDYIVTPTRVISCADHQSLEDCRPSKPPGIIWSLLRPSDLDRIPVLRRVRYREWKSGKNVRLSGEETDPNDLEDIIMPEPHVSNHGDYRKPGPSGNQDRNYQKSRKEKLTASGGQQEINDGEDEAKETLTKVTTDDQKMFRYERFHCRHHSCS